MGKMKELWAQQQEDQDQEDEAASQEVKRQEQEYAAADARGEICPGCDGDKKSTEIECEFCASGSRGNFVE